MQEYLEFARQHLLLSGAFVAIVALIIWTELGRFTRGYKDVSPQEAVQIINHDDPLLLDIRENNELNEGVIGGAKHIPLGGLRKRINEIEKFKSRTLIVYCRSGSRSYSACNLLKKHEFGEVFNLKGGIMAWKSANLPLGKK